jgi:polar amino acid transport system permease protein
LLNQASSQQALYANPTPLTLAALLYLLIFLPFVIFSRFIEGRYAVKR